MPQFIRTSMMILLLFGAQAGPGTEPLVYLCWPTAEAPRIDGIMEPLWLDAPWTTAWIPLRADAPEDYPGFRALYDDTALYLFFRAPHLPEANRRRPSADDLLSFARRGEQRLDFLEERPNFPQFLTLYIDPRVPDSETYPRGEPGHFALRVPIIIPPNSMLGSGADVAPFIVPNAGYGELSPRLRNTWWPAGLQASLLYSEKGWVLEMAIPYDALQEGEGSFNGRLRMGEARLEVAEPPRPRTVWGIQAMLTYGTGAVSVWSPAPKEQSAKKLPPIRPFGRLLFAQLGPLENLDSEPTTFRHGRAFYQMPWHEAAEIATRRKIPIIYYQAAESVWDNPGFKMYSNLPAWDELEEQILPIFIPFNDAEAAIGAPIESGERGCVIVSWRGKITWRGNIPPPLPMLREEIKKLELMERTTGP